MVAAINEDLVLFMSPGQTDGSKGVLLKLTYSRSAQQKLQLHVHQVHVGGLGYRRNNMANI